LLTEKTGAQGQHPQRSPLVNHSRAPGEHPGAETRHERADPSNPPGKLAAALEKILDVTVVIGEKPADPDQGQQIGQDY